MLNNVVILYIFILIKRPIINMLNNVVILNINMNHKIFKQIYNISNVNINTYIFKITKLLNRFIRGHICYHLM